MAEILASRRPGVRPLRTAWLSSTGKADSGGEVVLQVFHDVLEIQYVAQHELYNDAGQLVARADLWIVGTSTFVAAVGSVAPTCNAGVSPWTTC